ncbi:bifunctional phosphoserine phosphatase/homoserine phosphotransferase ThrH [Duganella sp. S19_KUP01_CR8]|uniref:bifunctional phosphoserine phosphatase/homoserine phosphotransferase ThrH n=1 Tax=Duganella sp. S19_KUP01_CR8 TaxID=3025502 RepID=UPI002FCDD715
MTNIACVDLEGVLAPEMWPFIGSVAGIPGLKITTREEPDYYSLMVHRIALLRKHGLKLMDVQAIVAALPALDGAADFLATLRSRYRVLIVSDAFIEFAAHFASLLGSPELQCHRLSVDADGFIDSCLFLPRRGKEETVQRLQQGGHRVLAIGDAFNDLAMLRAADRGFLFRPSRQTLDSAQDLCVVRHYGDILRQLRQDSVPQWICEEIAK